MTIDSHRLRRLQRIGLALTTTILLALSGIDRGEARREVWTEEQKTKLQQAERVHVETVALAADGAADRTALQRAVATRLSALGYTIVEDPSQPHELTLKVKCEERKTWEGPLRSGGDADQPDAAARLWKGPACQFGYRLEQQWSDWRHEVRTKDATDKGRAAMEHLLNRLQDDPFPFLLAAEWGQPARLLKVLSIPQTAVPQQTTIVTLLGEMSAVEAIPALGQAAKSPEPPVAQAALVALGNIGHEDGIPILLAALGAPQQPTRLAAIKGLGRLAALHPTSDIVPALLAQLPQENIPGQIEIVRALGRTTDRRILPPLKALNRSVQDRTRSDSAAELKELRVALGQALDQFDGTHTEE